MPHTTNETLRKSLHIAFGLFAITLKWLPWWGAAAIAACAVLGNWLVLHRIVGRGVSRHERGYDSGIVLYPLGVFVLIVLFRHQLHYAAVAWLMMAAGDGVASIAGRALPIAALPWNRAKSVGGSLAFFLAGSAAGIAGAYWMGWPHPGVVMVTALTAAIAESLDLGIDDNISVPFASAVTLVIAGVPVVAPFATWPHTPAWLVVNALLALAGYFARSVNFSGALGGWLLGAIIILGAGWPLYVALLAFFIIGTAATKLGYARKAKAGLAQEGGGRRGFSHAFSNAGVAAICAIAASRLTRSEAGAAEAELLPMFMGIASLATAAADTTASEIGQLVGRRAFLPLTLRRVPVGTEGAVSVEGTAAGAVAGLAVALAGAQAMNRLFVHAWFGWEIVLTMAICAFLGSYLESIAGSWNRRQERPIPNGVLNFFNTAVGALLFLIAARWLGLVDWGVVAR